MRVSHSQFAVGPQLCVENMEKPELIDASHCQVVARGMKGEGDEGSIGVEFFFDFEVKHPQQFAAEILVVPDANGAILLAASGHKRSLFADVHASDGVVVKAFVEIFEDYFLVGEVVEQI